MTNPTERVEVLVRASEDELQKWEAQGFDINELRREACHRPLSAAVAHCAEVDLVTNETAA